MFGNSGFASVSNLYFRNSLEWLLLLEVCWKVDASYSAIISGSVVGVLFSLSRAGIVWYVLLPLIVLIFFQTSADGVDELRVVTYLNHDCFLLSLMVFRDLQLL